VKGLQPTRPPPIDRHDGGGAANASCAGQRGGAAPDGVTGVPHGRFWSRCRRNGGPHDDYEDEWSPPPAADNENDADAGAVAGLASDARSVPQELDEVPQACRERGEATANDEESEINGASQPPRLQESDLVSICEAYVALSVGTEGVAAAVGGASSAAGSGRGPCQTNVVLKDVFDTTW